MKKYSWAIIYAFVAGLIFPNAFAAEKTENKTPAKTQTQTKAPVKKSTKPQPKESQKSAPQNEELEQFNRNVSIQFIARGVQTEENNQSYVTLTYQIQNKGKNQIQSLGWVSSYVIGKQTPLYSKELPLEFEPPLASGKQMEITIRLPLSELPEAAQKQFLSKTADIHAINKPKQVSFSSGSKIVVTK